MAAAFFALFAFRLAGAQSPPQPDFFWPYGTATVGGANLAPAVQPVIALINGKACGSSTTRVAEANPDNPPADVGRTVYVVNVEAAGSGPGQSPGCGMSGLPVMLYFPAAGRIAIQAPAFSPGGRRVDLELGISLSTRLQLPMTASEGTP